MTDDLAAAIREIKERTRVVLCVTATGKLVHAGLSWDGKAPAWTLCMKRVSRSVDEGRVFLARKIDRLECALCSRRAGLDWSAS